MFHVEQLVPNPNKNVPRGTIEIKKQAFLLLLVKKQNVPRGTIQIKKKHSLLLAQR